MLGAGKTYAVVIIYNKSFDNNFNAPAWEMVNTTAEDANPAPGWSIGNTIHTSAAGSTSWRPSSHDYFKAFGIRVNGTAGGGEPVWSATMTAGDTPVGHGYDATATPAVGALDDDDSFDYGSLPYTVLAIDVAPNVVRFAVAGGLSKDEPLTLEFGGHAFAFSDRISPISVGVNWYWSVPAALDDLAAEFPVGSTATVCLRTDTQVCPLGRIVASELRVADDVSAEEGENLTFTVELSPASEVFAETVTVDWATSGGTATSGTDFSEGSGTLTFAPGVTEQTFTVATIEDMTDEDHETFTVTLSNATSAAISGATATGTIENDDWPPLAWSTTLTVGNDFLAFEHYGYYASVGSLTDPNFRYRSATYVVEQVTVTTGREVFFYLDRSGLPTEDFMTLEIDGHEFPFGDRKSESTDKTWVWDAPADLHDPATNFPVDSTATVCLYTEGNACPTDDNAAPSFSSSATFDAAENQTTAGAVLATDSDAGDDVTGYEITGGADEALFEIGATDGALTFKTAPNFEDAKDIESIDPANAAGNNQYVVVVTATSGTGTRVMTATQTITVTVTNADEGQSGTVTIDDTSPAVGDELMASTADAADPDGLPDPFEPAWKWYRTPDGGSETEISGAASATYTVVEADLGATLTAKASWTDKGEFENTLSSAATSAVAAAAALPTLSIADAKATEGSDVTFTVTLSDAATEEVTATWMASIESGDTAVAADDLGSTTGTLTIAAGVTTATVTVATAQDSTDEDEETFTVTLSSPSSNAQLATDPTAEGRIVDDDAPPSLSVDDATAPEGRDVNFPVRLSAASGRQVTATWTASVVAGSDTAVAADFADLSAATGTLTIAAGVTTATVAVAIAADSVTEDEETFTLTLSSPRHAELADATAQGTITDADPTDVALASLELSGVELTPPFAAETLSYTGAVNAGVASTTVTAAAREPASNVEIGPDDADDTSDGHQVALNLAAGATRDITVTVTSVDGSARTYTVTVTGVNPNAPQAKLRNSREILLAAGDPSFVTDVSSEFTMWLYFVRHGNPVGFTVDDVVVRNGSVQTFERLERGTTGFFWYKSEIAVDTGADEVTVAIPANVIEGGNRPAQRTFTVDAEGPAIEFDVQVGEDEVVTGDFVVTIGFGEPIYQHDDELEAVNPRMPCSGMRARTSGSRVARWTRY